MSNAERFMKFLNKLDANGYEKIIGFMEDYSFMTPNKGEFIVFGRDEIDEVSVEKQGKEINIGTEPAKEQGSCSISIGHMASETQEDKCIRIGTGKCDNQCSRSVMIGCNKGECVGESSVVIGSSSTVGDRSIVIGTVDEKVGNNVIIMGDRIDLTNIQSNSIVINASDDCIRPNSCTTYISPVCPAENNRGPVLKTRGPNTAGWGILIYNRHTCKMCYID